MKGCWREWMLHKFSLNIYNLLNNIHEAKDSISWSLILLIILKFSIAKKASSCPSLQCYENADTMQPQTSDRLGQPFGNTFSAIIPRRPMTLPDSAWIRPNWCFSAARPILPASSRVEYRFEGHQATAQRVL